MATHSNDGSGDTDPRLARIPARSFEQGAMRPIYASPEGYPRYVGKERLSPTYFAENCEAGSQFCKEFVPIGYIPQVENTFAYFEETYGTINEMQVAIAESTCSGVYSARAVNNNGKALLSIDQLSQISMERASTSKQAVSIMGELAEKYGFYGESDSFEGGSESLFIIDPNEAWVFHVLADPTGSSAIWVGARVPDDSVAVVANMFSIREVNLSDTDNFLGRQDMWELAIREGLYKEGDVKDFTATFSDGEYAHKYYSGRRMWGVFNALAPSLNLPANYDNLKIDKPYPFAVKVEKLLTPQDLFAVMRIWYEGTEFSTSAGLAGGPFGTPDRYSNSQADSKVAGNWERTIAIYRSSDSYVIQSRSWLPNPIGGLVWYGAAAAHGTTYAPIMSGMLQAPDCLSWGWQGVYNLTTSFWAARSLLNLAQINFSYMIQDIQLMQKRLESNSLSLVNAISQEYSGLFINISRNGYSNEQQKALELISNKLNENAQLAVSESFNLFHSMMFKYADGWSNTWTSHGFVSVALGYPTWWLESVEYVDGPEPVSNAEVNPMLPRSSRIHGSQGMEIEAKSNRDPIKKSMYVKSRMNEMMMPAKDEVIEGNSMAKNSRCGGLNLKDCLFACNKIAAMEIFRSCSTHCLYNC